MAKGNIESKKGFTIIEVVLVLAIAGLIFLMVFVALPALQRSQRDTQRRNDMSRLITAIQNYQSNNNNKIPYTYNSGISLDDNFIGNYLTVNGDSFNDPSTGETYMLSKEKAIQCTNVECPNKSTGDDAAPGIIYAYISAKCNGENPEYIAGKSRIAFTIKLEGAGTYCASN